MIDYLTNPQIITGFLTLAVLEIVLGIDNLIFLSIVSQKLPPEHRKNARRIGLALALIMRVGLLFALTWIIGMTTPIMMFGEFGLSWRDVVLGVGGAFLIYKGTMEIHTMTEGEEEHVSIKHAGMVSVILQIMVLDLVFSLDSIVTAVGMVNELPIMIAAVVVAIMVMLVAAEPVSAFINDHPSVKMLALSFLLLVGVALVADAAHFHIPRGYLYVAIAFSMFVEAMNLIVSKKKKKSG
ncbi:TerC family protein [Govanella unica]|uniref:TerC family protein n=1 Tax=Govanella unica TaxID=2975056 RepID=A0A9X3TWZ2_9PROT|nr:TerC family protein [Govania unica]MDA5193227.1 TerC family protein [Govania unica]